jgi:hypothetical protein
MSKWSSFEKQQLLTESWREYLNEEELQEIFGKRAWEKLVDDFAKEDEGAAQLATRLGLKRADVTGPGGKALDIAQIEKKVKDLLDITKKANDPELTKATQDLVQNVKQTVKAGGDEQAADAAIKDDPTPVEVEEEFPIEITTKNFANFIERSNFSKIAPLFKKVGVDKSAEEIKQMISKNLPAFFKSFEKLLDRSDVGDYFQLQAGLSETINIKDRIGVGSDPVSNLMIFVFGSLLRNYIRELSKTLENVPEEKAQQLVNSVAGLTKLTLKSIIDSKPKSQKAAEEPTQDVKAKENFDSDTGLPISDEGRDKLLDSLSKATTRDEFEEIYNRLLQSKYGKEKDQSAIEKAIQQKNPMVISGFGGDEEKRVAVRSKFQNLFLPDETTDGEPTSGGQKKEPARRTKTFSPLRRDEFDPEPEEEKADETSEAKPEATAEPEEEETDETPEGVVTSILKGRGVDAEDIKAFLEDLKKLQNLEEVSQKDAAEALGIDVKKYKELMEKHPRVLAAIQKTRQKEAKEKLLKALAKIVVKNAAPSEAEPAVVEPKPKDKKTTPKVKGPEGVKKINKQAKEKAKQVAIKPPPEKKVKAAVKEPEKLPEVKFLGKERVDDAYREYGKEGGVVMFELVPERAPGTKQKRFVKVPEDQPYDNKKEAVEEYLSLYKALSKVETRLHHKTYAKSYLVGLKDFIESFDKEEQINESVMLRWKTIAGIK